ncbi:sigma-70 family RNA polymerase sigma factor [Hespellia stercorisuis]|uniref:RNA polymerase sigma factor, sigma-70 family n=1 Tax=Hespellia stercorisuis DSM 15480 TaxID=1121950 RepID=A0A1M6QSE8_9FIRM|nr:sigma-70 family RNA polymerase sigma factor [Hespellia stercorisuis]SHK23136.1 RNA polymerase sigma factor, sigma-70 family [Hespellia stercorisuis DSM 15480]
MLTLEQLRNLVEEPKAGAKLPTARALRESDCEIVVKEIMGNGAELTVYKNGYALYQIKNRATVFPVNGCKSYSYATNKEDICVDEHLFDQEKWYIRLMLEGEDRLSHNFYMKEKGHQVSYSAEAEDWDALSDQSDCLADRLIQQEMMEELLQMLTNRQRKVVVEYFYMEKTHQQIADELGITRPAVSDAIAKALKRMKKIVLK